MQNKRNSNLDSQSYSLESHDSIDENVIDRLKKSLELKNYESASSTVDLGQSASKSHFSAYQNIQSSFVMGNKINKLSHIRNSTLNPNREQILQKYNHQIQR